MSANYRDRGWLPLYHANWFAIDVVALARHSTWPTVFHKISLNGGGRRRGGGGGYGGGYGTHGSRGSRGNTNETVRRFIGRLPSHRYMAHDDD